MNPEIQKIVDDANNVIAKSGLNIMKLPQLLLGYKHGTEMEGEEYHLKKIQDLKDDEEHYVKTIKDLKKNISNLQDRISETEKLREEAKNDKSGKYPEFNEEKYDETLRQLKHAENDLLKKLYIIENLTDNLENTTRIKNKWYKKKKNIEKH